MEKQKHGLLTRMLAIVGTLLIWLPLAAPLFFGLVRLVAAGDFRFDFLMPAELFPVVLVGALLLIWAAVRSGSYRRPIIGGFVAAVLLLVGGQALAVVTGLASGATEPAGLAWAAVVAALVLYIVALIAIGVGGILLLRGLFGRRAPPSGPA